MILNNYWNYRAYFDRTRCTGSESTASIPGFYDIQGENTKVIVGLNGGYVNMDRMTSLTENRCSRLRLGAYLSSSTADPVASAYMITDDITSNFSNIVTNTNTYTDGNAIKTVIVVTGDNTSGSSQTIGSVGIYKLMHQAETYDGEEYVYPYLMLIHKLSSTITVPAGEGFSIPLEWIEQ